MTCASTPLLIPPAARTQSTQALLDYFAATNEGERSEAFKHLVRICVVAVRPLYAPADDDDGLVDTPSTRSTRTREWIELWVLKFLAPHRGESHEELMAAADNDEFRYVGRQCRLDLLNVIRDAVKKRRPRSISLATPVEAREGFLTLLDCIGTERQDAPSSWPENHNSFEESLQCVDRARQVVQANCDELARLDLLDGLRAFLANAEWLEGESLYHFHARIVRSVAAIRHVSVQSARAYLRNFCETMARELANGNRAVLAIRLELLTVPPTYKVFMQRLAHKRVARYPIPPAGDDELEDEEAETSLSE